MLGTLLTPKPWVWRQRSRLALEKNGHGHRWAVAEQEKSDLSVNSWSVLMAQLGPKEARNSGISHALSLPPPKKQKNLRPNPMAKEPLTRFELPLGIPVGGSRFMRVFSEVLLSHCRLLLHLSFRPRLLHR